MPNFTEFSRADARMSLNPAVTVTRRGVLGFNRAAMNALDNPGAVAFLVDTELRLLGFRPMPGLVAVMNSMTRSAAEVRAIRRPGKQFLVSATDVLRHLGADLSAARRYPLGNLDGTWCIDLNESGTVVTSNRHKAA